MRNTRILLAVTAVALAAADARAQAPAGPAQSTILERVLVRVNGEIFTQTQLVQRQTDAIREQGVDTQNMPEAALVKLIGQVTPRVLVDAVDELLLVQRGRELGARFSEEEFTRALESIKTENDLDDAGLQQAMVQEGLTMEELRANFERAYLVQAVQSQDILSRMRVTEEELRQYYAANRQEFMTPETVTLRELAILVPGSSTAVAPSPDALAAARSEIGALRERALGGEDFAAIVQEHSDSPTAASGGIIGPVEVADVTPAVKALVDALEPGEISEPVQAPRGYQVLKLESREASALPPFDEVRQQIEQAVRIARLGGEMERLLDRLRAAAVVEWKDDNLRKIYEQQLLERALSPS